MKLSTFLSALLCLCVLLVTSWADAAVTRTRTRSTCSSGQCGQSAAAPRVYRSTQTTRTQTTTVRRSR
jgi:hypothetical protein